MSVLAASSVAMEADGRAWAVDRHAGPVTSERDARMLTMHMAAWPYHGLLLAGAVAQSAV